MELVPLSVDRVARGWDDQQLDLTAAAGQVATAPTAGFPPPVLGPAARFVRAWQRHLAGLADDAGSCADRLRAVVADLLDTDAAVGAELVQLQALAGAPR